MDILEINRNLLSAKQDHMKHTIKYKRIVKKIVSLINIPEVLYKYIFNFVGSSKFPDHYYRRSIRPRYVPKNNSIFHHKMIEERQDREQ